MIELKDLMAPARRTYHSSQYLSPAQMAYMRRAPLARPSDNGALLPIAPNNSSLELIGIAGGSNASLSDLKREGYVEGMGILPLIAAAVGGAAATGAFEGGSSHKQRVARFMALQAMAAQQEAEKQRVAAQLAQDQAARDAELLEAANKRLMAQQAFADNYLKQQQMQQARAQAVDLQRQQDELKRLQQEEMMRELGQKQLQQVQQARLEKAQREFFQNAADQSAAQSMFNQEMDASRWQQKQQDELLRQSQAQAAQRAASIYQVAKSAAPIPKQYTPPGPVSQLPAEGPTATAPWNIPTSQVPQGSEDGLSDMTHGGLATESKAAPVALVLGLVGLAWWLSA
jgi:hypothetical protein